MPHRGDPIFVIDSGLGGLTVARAILARLPGERVVYFGDTARLPYGSKTKQTVTSFVRQIVAWGLHHHRPKHVVIACNTASALALPQLRNEFAPLAIWGVVEPGARAAAQAAGTKEAASIGVIATEATVRSEAYQRAIGTRRRLARIFVKSTPLLVPMIEEGRMHDDPIVELVLREYLKSLTDRDITALVLGCTHYPLYAPVIQRIVGKDVRVIDSAEQCAEDVARRLAADGLSADPRQAQVMDDCERISAYVTDDPERFQRLAHRFLGFSVDRPTLVAPETLYQSIDSATPAAASDDDHAEPLLRLPA